MATPFIGLIVGARTRTLYAVLNPDNEKEIDNPRHLLTMAADFDIKEPIAMLRIEHGAFEIAESLEDIDTIIDAYYGDRVTRQSRVKAAHSAEPLVGVIIGTATRAVYMLHSFTNNADLDNPRLLLTQNDKKEPVTMITLSRGTDADELNFNEVSDLINTWYAQTSRVYTGKEYLDPV